MTILLYMQLYCIFALLFLWLFVVDFKQDIKEDPEQLLDLVVVCIFWPISIIAMMPVKACELMFRHLIHKYGETWFLTEINIRGAKK
jgi:hypothetical protein